MELIKDSKGINTAIAGIKSTGANLDAKIQLVALSVLAHIDQHYDVTLADRLVNAMPKSGRKLALVEFLLQHGKMTVIPASSKENKALIADGRVFFFAKDKVTDLVAAEEKPWYEMRKEATPSTAFDVQAQVRSLISRMNNAAKAGLTIEHKAEALAELKALQDALQA